MCVLCGGYVMQVHWTDRKIDNQEGIMTVTAGQNQRTRLRERHSRIRLANKILSHYGMQLSDWTGTKYILKDKKGRTEIVQDLGSLWAAAQKLAGRPIDPLNLSLIGRLNEQQKSQEQNT
jgi:hypothetical protein